MVKRGCVVILVIAHLFSIVSCSSYQLLDSTPDAIDEVVAPGDRVRVRLSEGERIEDTVVRVSDDVLTCRFHEFRRNEIEMIERWRFDPWRTLSLVGGVVGSAALICLWLESMLYWGPGGTLFPN